MSSNIKDKAEGIYPADDKKISGEKIDKSKFEGEGACEKIVGEDEKKVCEVKS
jgi:hypothetical protein